MDPILVAYKNAKQRCRDKNCKDYVNYGGRGIKFCFESLDEFRNCLGNRPDGYTFDRIDVNGDYIAGNVRWATRKEQSVNRRTFTSNTSGIKGVHYKPSHDAWVARCGGNTRITLYHGKDFFDACCARKAWENISSIR